MKISQLIFFCILMVFLTESCKSTKDTVAKVQVLTDQLFLFQNGEETLIGEMNEAIEIDKQAFSLRFYNKKYNYDTQEFYSAQIAAFLNKSELDKIQEGMQKTDLLCFEPGSGMASNKSGKYESLIFNNSGHHYTIYENSESKRLNVIGEFGEYLKLEFEILGLYYDDKEVKIKETDLDEFYLAFLIDRNLNGKIDKGELNKLTIKIK